MISLVLDELTIKFAELSKKNLFIEEHVMQIKFLFINAIDSSKEIETRYPPLGIGYLVSSLRKRFGENVAEFKIVENNIEQELISFKPHIVGISSVSQNHNKTIEYAAIVKKYRIPVICGSVHISVTHSSLTRNMDVGVIGEGDRLYVIYLNYLGKKEIYLKIIYERLKE